MAPGASQATERLADAALRKRGTALLVDDEERVRLSTADMLGELGSAVVKAVSGEAALGMVDRGERFDLLVTDHFMPGITGTDLARPVRGLQPDVPVLLVSGYAETDGVAAGLPQLTKPFRKDELASSLARLDCPSSDDLRRFGTLRNGGSGLSGLRDWAACAWWRKRRSVRV